MVKKIAEMSNEELRILFMGMQEAMMKFLPKDCVFALVIGSTKQYLGTFSNLLDQSAVPVILRQAADELAKDIAYEGN